MKYTSWLLITIITTLTFGTLQLQSQLNKDTQIIKDSLVLSRLGINQDKLALINKMLDDNIDPLSIMESEDYKIVVMDLNRVTHNFPLNSRWSYVISHYDPLTARMVALSIPVDTRNPATYPSYRYEIKDHPHLQQIMNGIVDVDVSPLRQDKLFGGWVRTGVIRLDQVRSYLAVDLDSQYIVSRIGNSFIVGLLYTSGVVLLILLALKKLAPAKETIIEHKYIEYDDVKEYKCDECEDEDDSTNSK